jgi:regulator of protease activity HflC (stomatin/prohibitin superfamily)
MFNKSERGQGIIGWIAIVLVTIVVFILLFGLYIVPAGSVGIITQWSAVKYVVQPGLGWRTPIAQGVVKMSVRTTKDQVDVGAASANLQTVTATIAVNYHLDGVYAAEVYQNIGKNYPDTVLAPAIQDIFKSTTAQFTAEELITKREQVRLMAEEALKAELAKYHVIVESFNIVNFDFSAEFNAAIEAKQVAQQAVETAKQRQAQAQIDANTAVITAQGQADAQKALVLTLDPLYVQYLAITKWNGVLPSVTSGAIPFIDVAKTVPLTP